MRSTARAKDDLRIGDWLVSPSANCIRGEGGDVSLQPLSMDVLLFLAERQGEVVLHRQLIDALWPDRYAGEDVVHRQIANLRNKLGDSARSPKYIETIPKRGYRLVASVSGPPGRRSLPMLAGAAASVAVIAALALALSGREPYGVPAPPTDADELAAVRAAILDERFDDARVAFSALPDPVRHSADAQSLEDLLDRRVDIETTPPGAQVRVKPFGVPDGTWEMLGVTPLTARLPMGTWIVEIIGDGRAVMRLALPNPGTAFNNVGEAPFVIDLPPAASVPTGMVYVPPVEAFVPLVGYRREEDLGAFFIGKTEVTNSEYAEFIAADGYQTAEYWTDLPSTDDQERLRTIATQFVDATGQPGPAFWTTGRFEAGAEDLPVTGVSWYEAMAYARFRNANLPSARHWARAALGLTEGKRPLAKSLLAVANIDTNAPRAVSDGRALSTWGASNMVGNVREWTRGYSGDRKLSLGSSFAGPKWQYAMPYLRAPMDRSGDQGFRLAIYPQDFEIRALSRKAEPRAPTLAPDDREALRERLAYVEGTLAEGDAEIVQEFPEERWIRRKLLLPTARSGDPLPVWLFLPAARGKAPMQTVIFLPPGSSYAARLDSRDASISDYHLEHIVEDGRAIVWPVLWGTFERYRTGDFDTLFKSYGEAVHARRDEIGRLIDYLVASREFSNDGIGLLSVSYGSSFVAPFILASEHRIRAAAVLAGIMPEWNPDKAPLALNPNSYWQLVRTPILFGNGVYDVLGTTSATNPTLYNLVATPDAHKRYVAYETAHWPLPRHRVERDVGDWFAEYLGRPPVEDIAAKDPVLLRPQARDGAIRKPASAPMN